MSRWVTLSLTLIVTLVCGRLQAAEHVMIVGGGPLPEESQVSIERNVLWIDALTRGGFDGHRLLFTAGPEKVKDVIEQRADDETLRRYLPLSRIFGEQYDALSVFRGNRLDAIDAPSSARSVDRQLDAALKGLQTGDSLWFIYNGHGGMESSDPSENTLRLWDDSTLDVRRFAAIAHARPPGTVLRSFMPQCFSGGFARGIALTPEAPDADRIDRLQCGFYSVPANQESEGCTVSVDSGEYRDYATFFFAALSGQTRQGEPVAIATADGGAPTLLDAHRWAYVNGESTDVPFSSSEYFLELWQPWYARWQSVAEPSADNRYFQIARQIAADLKLTATSLHAMAREASRRRAEIEFQILDLRDRLSRLDDEEQKLRRAVLQQFLHHYPEALFPYAARWNTLLREKEAEILGWITNHPDYPRLEKLQNRLDALDRELLEVERNRAMILRLQRMLNLATRLELFERLADDEARQTYAALLDCESWTPPLARKEVTDAR